MVILPTFARAKKEGINLVFFENSNSEMGVRGRSFEGNKMYERGKKSKREEKRNSNGFLQGIDLITSVILVSLTEA